jgi:Patatin-like phospholipase
MTATQRLFRRFAFWALALAASAAPSVLCTACSPPPRKPMSEAQLQDLARADDQKEKQEFHDTITGLLARADRAARAPAHDGDPPTLNFLALSGGGDKGAFGAGFLVGWGAVTDPKWRRPEFDAVSGVSTGALLAPFAFIGTDEACRQVEDFYRHPKDTWIQDRGTLFFLPWHPSFMTIPGLEKDIRAVIDEKMIKGLAAGSEAGRTLAVSATNLDLGRQRFWNLGLEAQAAAKSGDNDRVVRMLMASAAIPAVFPPIEIDGFVYGDGGVSANVLLRLDAADPDAFLQRWIREHPGQRLPRIRYWIIVNNQLQHVPKVVELAWPSIISPSLAVSIRQATIAEIRWLGAQADYVDSVRHTNIEVRVVAIPDDWRPPVPGEFKQQTMESLSDLGRKLGADPASWTMWGGSGAVEKDQTKGADQHASGEPGR